MIAAIKFWLAKALIDLGLFLGVVALIALWFLFLYGMARFSNWRMNRVNRRRP